MLCKVVTKNSEKLRVRYKPSLDSDIVGYLYRNNIYDVEPINDEWAAVVTADTTTFGYASRAYLQPVNDDITITFKRDELKAMVDYINSLLGE